MADANDTQVEKGLVDPRALYLHRLFRSWRMQRVYYASGRFYDALHVGVGFLALVANGFIIQSAIVSNFVNVGWIAVCSIVLVALQTAFKFADTANKLRATGAKFARLRDQLEDIGTCPVGSDPLQKDDPWVKELKKILAHWDKIRTGSPNVPYLIWLFADWWWTTAKFNKDHKAAGIIQEPTIPA
jgi:hypothetical protein